MSATAAKAPLLICRHGPWSADAAACVELALTCGVFEQQPVLVLLDSAVTLLRPGQDGDAMGMKTLARQVPAFELYDIAAVYADAAALQAHGIEAGTLEAPVRPLDAGGLASLVAAAGQVLVF